MKKSKKTGWDQMLATATEQAVKDLQKFRLEEGLPTLEITQVENVTFVPEEFWKNKALFRARR